MKTISLEEFIGLYKYETEEQFMYPYLKIAYVFYALQEHKQDYYIVDNTHLEELEPDDLAIYKELLTTQDRLSTFGFLFKTQTQDVANLNLQTVRDYILILPKMSPADYFVSCIPQIIEKQKWSEIVPTWFVDLNNYSEYNIQEDIQKAVQKYFPNCQSLVYHENFLEQYQMSRDISEILQEQDAYYFKETKRHLVSLNITDAIDNFQNIYTNSNENLCSVFNDMIDNIMSKVTQDTLILYQGNNFFTYVRIACHLTYFYRVNCYIPEALHKQYFGTLSQMFFNREGLLEHNINYLRNFPTFGFMNTDYTVTYVATLHRYLKCKVYLVRVDDILSPNLQESDVQVIQDFDLTKVQIKPLLDLFELNSENLENCKTYEKQLRGLYNAAEKILNLSENTILNVSNTFFCIIGDSLHLAYTSKLEFSTDSILVADVLLNSKNPNLAATRVSLDLKKAYKVLPLDILQANSFAKKILMKIEPKLAPEVYQQKIGIPKPKQIREIKPIKTFSPMGIVFMYYMINPGRCAISPLPTKYFHDIGLYSPYTLSYRQGVVQYLLNTIKRDSLRDNSFISCYGGYHPLISPRLIIGEDSLK